MKEYIIIHANFNSNGCGCKGKYYINVSQKYLDNVRDDMTELCQDEYGMRYVPRVQIIKQILSIIME